MKIDKSILISISIGVALVLVSFIIKPKQKKSLNPKEQDPELSKKYNFHLIPDGKNNYRSAQFTEKELPYIIKKYNIKTIVRLNGDNLDSKHRSNYPETSRAKEKSICNSLGCEFIQLSPHSGYKEGQGYAKSIVNATEILEKGNVLIHCAHGADRTGGMVAGYLKTKGIMTNKDELWNYTTQYNGWNSMIRNNRFFGTGYDKLADGFYPLNELKAKVGRK